MWTWKKPRLLKIWSVFQESIYKKLSEFNVYDIPKTNPITTTGILTHSNKVWAPNTHVISSNKSPNWQKANSSKKY